MNLKNLNLAPFAVGEKKDSIVKLAKKMKTSRARNIYILEGKKPIGVVSLVDINNEVIAEGKDCNKVKAEDIMNAPVWSVDEKEELGKAYYLMLEKQRYALPVTSKGNIIGILPIGEALKGAIKEKRENASAEKK